LVSIRREETADILDCCLIRCYEKKLAKIP